MGYTRTPPRLAVHLCVAFNRLTNRYLLRGSLKDEAPSKPLLPLSFKGEGDKGGEVNKSHLNPPCSFALALGRGEAGQIFLYHG